MEDIPINPLVDEARSNLEKKFDIDFEELFKLRKSIHMEPEIGFEEYKTKEKIIEYLVKQGAEKSSFKYFAKTGFTYDIVGTAPACGEEFKIGFRSELDGLNMQELNTFPHASKIPNRAHMCGHDGHMATLAGLGCIFLKNRHLLPSNKTIRLVFQPSEEIEDGGKRMVAEGAVIGLNEIYGNHISPLPYGIFATAQNGPASCAFAQFDIEIKMNKDSVVGSPLTTGCMIHTQIHSISTLNLLPKENGICTVGKFEGDEFLVTMNGTIRAETEEMLNIIMKRLETIVISTSAIYNCVGKVIFSLLCPPVINAKIPSKCVKDATISLYGPQAFAEFVMSATEDFAFMAKVVPAAYIIVGQKMPGAEMVMNHSPYFEYEERVIPANIQIWLKLATLRLGGKFLP